MATLFLSVKNGIPPYGPVSNVGVTEGTSTVAAASVNVELNTTICPGLSYSDAIAQIQAVLNYIQSDAALTAANRVLGLAVP